MDYSNPTRAVKYETESMAKQGGRIPNSVDLLMGLISKAGSTTKRILAKFAITLEWVQDRSSVCLPTKEHSTDSYLELLDKAEALAPDFGFVEVRTELLLNAILKTPCVALGILEPHVSSINEELRRALAS